MRIDLVAAVYLANVYMGNMHLKCTPNNIAAWLLHLMYMMRPRSSSGGVIQMPQLQLQLQYVFILFIKYT